MTDQQLAVQALRKAGRVIAEYLEPGHRPDAIETWRRRWTEWKRALG
jgi:hypothetical protein